MSDETTSFHLESGQVAAYLDSTLPPDDLREVEPHLAECDVCRAEVVALAGVLRTAPHRRVWIIPTSLVAAAAVLVLVVPGLIQSGFFTQDRYREPDVVTTPSPVALSPVGEVDSVYRLVFSQVSGALRYRVTLMDSAGSAVWRVETVDTAVALPDSVRPRAGATYFWRVEAEAGWDRWVPSELADFTVGGMRR